MLVKEALPDGIYKRLCPVGGLEKQKGHQCFRKCTVAEVEINNLRVWLEVMEK